MTNEELKRKAKVVLENGGVKVFQKDMDEVIVHKLQVRDYIPHREIVYVRMKDGTTYEALQETVDQEGNFSLGSAKYITKEVRKGHL